MNRTRTMIGVAAFAVAAALAGVLSWAFVPGSAKHTRSTLPQAFTAQVLGRSAPEANATRSAVAAVGRPAPAAVHAQASAAAMMASANGRPAPAAQGNAVGQPAPAAAIAQASGISTPGANGRPAPAVKPNAVGQALPAAVAANAAGLTQTAAVNAERSSHGANAALPMTAAANAPASRPAPLVVVRGGPNGVGR